ncbi:hypothetical protein QJQ45_002987 [Haematococcus lacustris]|nr:hypothetical protein QJQ45_002987 [Haematococcus lacustris]
MAKAKKGSKASTKQRENETEDERRVRLEMEALQADENDRREQEAARLALRERQLREQRYAHLNGIKIHNQWRKIMRMAKVEELRREIEVLSQNHEREVDRKDAIVQMLDRDLEEAEEQYGMAVRAHMLVMDNMLDLQYQRMRAREQEFAADLRALEEEFDAERTEICNSHVRQKKDMADMIAAMEQEFADAENELRQEFEAQREEIKNRNSEEYNVLKIQLEGIIEELERHFEQAHKAYLESTEHRTLAFKQLTRNDAQAARVIEKRMRKLIRLQEALQHWRTKIATNSRRVREWEERNKALRSEKEIMTRHYTHLKSGMDHFRAVQGERLKALTLSSHAAMTELSAKQATVETVLKLCELCRKYETEQEKVLPFMVPQQAEALYAEVEAQVASEAADSSLNPATVEQKDGGGPGSKHAEQAAVGAGAESLQGPGSLQPAAKAAPSVGGTAKPRMCAQGLDDTGAEVEEWDYLNRFFRRYNKALLDKTAIDREKSRLEKENADLRSILKQYLDGISVNDDVLNNPINPLLVVNNRLQVTLAERNKARQQALAMRAQQAAPQLVAVNAAAAGGQARA